MPESDLRRVAKHIFKEASPKAKSLLKGYKRVEGKAIIFNIRDTGEAFAVKNTPNGPLFTDDASKIPDDAAVINLTDRGAKDLIRGKITPHEGRYKIYGEDGMPLLYITDVRFDPEGKMLSAPKQVVWLYAMSLFNMLAKEVRGMFKNV